jgi:hypothetical protein
MFRSPSLALPHILVSPLKHTYYRDDTAEHSVIDVRRTVMTYDLSS